MGSRGGGTWSEVSTPHKPAGLASCRMPEGGLTAGPRVEAHLRPKWILGVQDARQAVLWLRSIPRVAPAGGGVLTPVGDVPG